jgi:DNA-binding MarR family transcriptional regulator
MHTHGHEHHEDAEHGAGHAHHHGGRHGHFSEQDGHSGEHDGSAGGPAAAHPGHSGGRERPWVPDLPGRLGYLAVLMRRHEMAGRRGRSFSGGIRAGQGRVLNILSLQSPLGQKDLAYMLGVRPQSLSELLSKLEAGDLVERTRDESDRRSFLVSITDKGREAVEEISAPAESEPFDALDEEEQKTFSALLERIIAAAEAALPDGMDPREAFRGGPFGGRGGRGRGRGRGPGFGPGMGPGFGPGMGPGFGPGGSAGTERGFRSERRFGGWGLREGWEGR